MRRLTKPSWPCFSAWPLKNHHPRPPAAVHPAAFEALPHKGCLAPGFVRTSQGQVPFLDEKTHWKPRYFAMFDKKFDANVLENWLESMVCPHWLIEFHGKSTRNSPDHLKLHGWSCKYQVLIATEDPPVFSSLQSLSTPSCHLHISSANKTRPLTQPHISKKHRRHLVAFLQTWGTPKSYGFPSSPSKALGESQMLRQTLEIPLVSVPKSSELGESRMV